MGNGSSSRKPTSGGASASASASVPVPVEETTTAGAGTGAGAGATSSSIVVPRLRRLGTDTGTGTGFHAGIRRQNASSASFSEISSHDDYEDEEDEEVKENDDSIEIVLIPAGTAMNTEPYTKDVMVGDESHPPIFAEISVVVGAEKGEVCLGIKGVHAFQIVTPLNMGTGERDLNRKYVSNETLEWTQSPVEFLNLVTHITKRIQDDSKGKVYLSQEPISTPSDMNAGMFSLCRPDGSTTVLSTKTKLDMCAGVLGLRRCIFFKFVDVETKTSVLHFQINIKRVLNRLKVLQTAISNATEHAGTSEMVTMPNYATLFHVNQMVSSILLGSVAFLPSALEIMPPSVTKKIILLEAAFRVHHKESNIIDHLVRGSIVDGRISRSSLHELKSITFVDDGVGKHHLTRTKVCVFDKSEPIKEPLSVSVSGVSNDGFVEHAITVVRDLVKKGYNSEDTYISPDNICVTCTLTVA
jgi:hypothetical protein